MQGTMQDHPLTLVHFFDRAESLFFDKGVSTATPTVSSGRPTGEWAERTRRLGGVLDALGISPEGRVATFGWNTARHLELYFAAPCTGRVLHTLNIRLFPEQLTYIVNHAEDEVIFVDRSLTAAALPAAVDLLDRQAPRRDGRRKGRGPVAGQRARGPRLRGAARRGVTGRLPRRRRTAGGVDVLHERHHRQPQGRRLHPPFDLPAHRWASWSPTASASGRPTPCCRWFRCSTPTRGAWPTPAWRPGPTS